MTLDEMMKLAEGMAKERAAEGEIETPFGLVSTYTRDSFDYFHFALSPEQAQLTLAERLLVENLDVAAVIIELWGARISRTSPYSERLRRGEMEVKDLPSEMRDDGLVIIGEDRDGHRQQKMYKIVARGKNPVFEPYHLRSIDRLWNPIFAQNKVIYGVRIGDFIRP